MSVEEKLKEYTLALDNINKRLQELEIEKETLIKSYNLAGEQGKKEIAIMMKESEEKFKNLCDEVLELSAKVKKLKNQC